MSEYVLETKDLKAYFFTLSGPVRAVDGVTVKLPRGKSLGIAGESGCGKSTFAYSLMNMLPPPGRIAGGKVIVDGMDVTSMSEEELRKKIRWKVISMIFQGAMNALNPVYTVGYQLAEPLIYHLKMSKEEALKIAADYLEMVGLSRDIIRRYPHELSGGMKQRVVIAMALLLNPKIVIADEPTTALDVVVQAQILNLLKKLQKERNISIILITHDLSIISEIADYVMIMYAGWKVEFGTLEQVYKSPAHPYTQKLLAAIPRLRGPKRKLEFIPGAPPDLIRPPRGCRFHPRCPYVMDICRKEEPPEVEVEKGHVAKCWLYVKR